MPLHAELDDTFRRFIGEQLVFFTATAPREGRINVSPKGMDTLRVLDDSTVAYLDLTGSGNETAAHLLDDGRLTIMFCSFGEAPLTLRLYGRGEVVHRQDARWRELAVRFPSLPGARQIIVLHIASVQTSCGQAVPVCASMRERRTLVDLCRERGDEWLHAHWRRSNTQSIDGLPTGLPVDELPTG